MPEITLRDQARQGVLGAQKNWTGGKRLLNLLLH